MNPVYVSAGDIPGDIVAAQRAELEKEFAASGKPPEVTRKIVDGKLAKFFDEQSLLAQAFVKDPSRKVGDVLTDAVGKIGENIRIEKFVRYEF